MASRRAALSAGVASSAWTAEELYNLKADPIEWDNLTEKEDFSEVLDKARSELKGSRSGR